MNDFIRSDNSELLYRAIIIQYKGICQKSSNECFCSSCIINKNQKYIKYLSTECLKCFHSCHHGSVKDHGSDKNHGSVKDHVNIIPTLSPMNCMCKKCMCFECMKEPKRFNLFSKKISVEYLKKLKNNIENNTLLSDVSIDWILNRISK